MQDLRSDLEFVRLAVENSRRALVLDAGPLLAWGLLTVLGVGLAYTVPRLDSVWLWVVIIGLAWAYTAVRAFRSSSGTPAQLFSQRALATLWFAVLSTMTLVGFAGTFSGSLRPVVIPPVCAALFGAAHIASGALMQQRWPTVLGLLWWLTAAALFFTPPALRLAVFGVAVLLLLVVPASRLRSR